MKKELKRTKHASLFEGLVLAVLAMIILLPVSMAFTIMRDFSFKDDFIYAMLLLAITIASYLCIYMVFRIVLSHNPFRLSIEEDKRLMIHLIVSKKAIDLKAISGIELNETFDYTSYYIYYKEGASHRRINLSCSRFCCIETFIEELEACI